MKDSVLQLAPNEKNEKIVDYGVDERIVAKTLSEQVAEGLLELSLSQKKDCQRRGIRTHRGKTAL